MSRSSLREPCRASSERWEVPLVNPNEVELTLPPSEAARFAGLLQRGVVVPAVTGCSLLSFLVDQIGIDPEYVRERISTIFLDGDVVDSVERAAVRDGAVLALSAAMPGLAGATLRRGGFYSAMRSTITHRAAADAPRLGAEASGTVRVKLFNLLIPELGPALLARGVVLEPGDDDGLLPRAGGAGLPAGPVLLRVRFAPTSP